MFYHKDITDILDIIRRELLLILKTNNYLRAIDKRLGNPNNTYNIINDVTWGVYLRELAPKGVGYWKELLYYWCIRLYFSLYVMKLRVQGMFGIKASKEEL